MTNAPSNNLGPQFKSNFREFLLAIRHSLFLLFFLLLIFLFNSSILASIHLFLFGGCCLRVESLGTLGSNNLRVASASLSFSAILSASRFMDLIFFLLNLALVLLDALVILSSKASIWDFRLSISATKFLNFLASLESLFLLCFICLLVRGTSNSGCSSYQVDICGGRFGSQVAPRRETSVKQVLHVPVGVGKEASVVSFHYSGEKLLTQLFSTENNLSIYAL